MLPDTVHLALIVLLLSTYSYVWHWRLRGRLFHLGFDIFHLNAAATAAALVDVDGRVAAVAAVGVVMLLLRIRTTQSAFSLPKF